MSAVYRGLPYILWKAAVYIFALVMIPIGLETFGEKFWTYMTFWGWCVLALYFFLCTVANFAKTTSWLPVRFFQALSFSLANIITLCRWGFPGTVAHHTGFSNLVYHGVNTAIMYLDLLLYPLRFRWWYIIPIIAFGLLYIAFSWFYYTATGIYQYECVNWKSINTLYWILAASVGLAVSFLIGVILSRAAPSIKISLRETVRVASTKDIPRRNPKNSIVSSSDRNLKNSAAIKRRHVKSG